MRHFVSTRIWHWINLIAIVVLLVVSAWHKRRRK